MKCPLLWQMVPDMLNFDDECLARDIETYMLI